MLVVGEDEVAEAMVFLLERTKLVVEGAGAVGVAALLAGKLAGPVDGTTVLVLSGGNVGAGLLAEVARRHETQQRRRLVLQVRIPDLPGSLAALLELVGRTGANLVDVQHIREGLDLHIQETAVQLVLETRGPEHAAAVRAAIEAGGYQRGDGDSLTRLIDQRADDLAGGVRLRMPLDPEHEARSGSSIASARSSTVERPVTTRPSPIASTPWW